jgi:hypothetical protein
MLFPLPDDLFPQVRVSEEDALALRQLAAVFVRDAVDQFEHFRVARGGVVDDTQWKFVKQRRGLSAFADRTLPDVAATARAQVAAAAAAAGSRPLPIGGPVVGNMSLLSTKLHAVMVVGTLEGELHDFMYGLHHSTTRELQLIKSSYMEDKVVDSKILATVVEPTVDEPLQGLHLKWAVSELAPFAARVVRKMLRPRDFVYLEAIGFVTTPAGERFGYNVLHSLKIPGVRELPDFQIVRGNYSICSVFRQKTPGTVQVFMKGFVDVVGDIPTSLAIPGSSKALMSYRKGIHCGQMKKLNWLLKNGKKMQRQSRAISVVADSSKVECPACGREQSLGRTKTCQACAGVVCEACVVTHRLSFLSKPRIRSKVLQRPTDFCPACVLTAITTDAVEIAAEELKQQRDPRETFETSSASDTLSQQLVVSPSNSELPDVSREFFG